MTYGMSQSELSMPQYPINRPPHFQYGPPPPRPMIPVPPMEPDFTQKWSVRPLEVSTDRGSSMDLGPSSPGKRRISEGSLNVAPHSPEKRLASANDPESPSKVLPLSTMQLSGGPFHSPGVAQTALPYPAPGNSPPGLSVPGGDALYRQHAKPHPGPILLVPGQNPDSASQLSPVFMERIGSADESSMKQKGKRQEDDASVGGSDSGSYTGSQTGSVSSSKRGSTFSGYRDSFSSENRPTFVTLQTRHRMGRESTQSSDSISYLEKQREEVKGSKDPKLLLEFAKSCLAIGDPYLDEGFGILKKLASNGYPEAHYFLGEAYADDENDKVAFAQFMMAAKRGYPPALHAVAIFAEAGRGCKKNVRLALDMYTKAATSGELGAMYRLGRAEMDGELGLRKDPVKATKWFRRAAAVPNRNHPEALFELANIYESGIPPYISQDFSFARGVLQEAADFGYLPAVYKLGYCYEHGIIGFDVNPAESIRLYTEAMNAGYTEALLGMAGWHMTGAEGLMVQNQTMAFLLVKEAAERALPRAQYTLGYFYEGGIGTAPDLDMAFKYYEMAAQQGIV
ncbi:hypothetical protein HDU91_006011 [Kappamyces sp. JEL0680]|nr:hypothetical protein HDU91_006011 [Kappamyces sp. JEL0680]